MDLSLDDYIRKKGPQVGPKQGPQAKVLNVRKTVQNGNQPKSYAQRPKQFQQKQQVNFQQNQNPGAHKFTGQTQPQFTVTGLGKVQGFDARQKLGQKSRIQDAREKIAQKKPMVDARVKIQNKKGTGIGPQTIQPQQITKNVDARQKIQLKQGQKIQLKQGQNTQPLGARLKPPPQVKKTPTVAPQRVMVTQFGRVLASESGVTETKGHLLKTVSNDEVASQPTLLDPDFSFTPEQDSQEYDSYSSLGLNIVKGPVIKVVNDHYEEPAPEQIKISRPISPISFASTTPQVSHQPLRLRSAPAVQQITHEPLQFSTPVQLSSRQPSYQSQQQSLSPEWITPSVSTVNKLPSNKVPTDDVVSPVQGYRILVTNLHPIVTQDDVIELFGCVGALKKARVIKQGLAEVVFVNKEDAVAAVKKYNNRELDGQPMQVRIVSGGGLTSPVQAAAPARPAQRITAPPKATAPARVMAPPKAAPVRSLPTAQPVLSRPEQSNVSFEEDLLSTSASIPQPLRLGKGAGGPGVPVGMDLIHKALFKSQMEDEAPSRPVTFTVKI